MPLMPQQVTSLHESIVAYAFPPLYFDFEQGVPVNAANMREVEIAVGGMLRSPHPLVVKNGLANVLYWGYAQIGYGTRRVDRFLGGVTTEQIEIFQALLAANEVPTLRDLCNIRMPQYSGISFLSKILTFINPNRHCVLDLQLARLGLGEGAGALHDLIYTTTIRVTNHNEEIYGLWCNECSDISNQYFDGNYRAVDIERGFFQLIQAGDLGVAQQIYADLWR